MITVCRAVLCLLAFLAFVGCQALPSTRSVGQRIPQEQLMNVMMDFSHEFTQRVESAADLIASRETDRDIQRRTVLWKLRAVPLCRRAVQSADVNLVVLDVWALCIQQRDYFEKGEGTDLFGASQTLAVDTSKAIEQSIQRIGKRLLPESQYESMASEVAAFAAENPLTGPFARSANRPSQAVADGGWSFSYLTSPFAAINPFSGLDEGAIALKEVAQAGDRFTEVVESLPEQVRWHSELLVHEMERSPPVAEALQSVAGIAGSSDRLIEVAERIPASVRAELTALFEESGAAGSGLRATLSETRATAQAIGEALEGADRAAAAAGEAATRLEAMGRACEQALLAFNETLRLLESDPHAPKAGPGDPADRPFDIQEWGETAEKLTSTASELRGLLAELRLTTNSEAIAPTVAVADTTARSWIDHATWRLVMLIGLVFVAALVYRFFTARLGRSPAAR